MGHVFWMGMWYIGYYKQSTFQTWRVFSRQPVLSAENEFNFIPFCKIHSSFLETYSWATWFFSSCQSHLLCLGWFSAFIGWQPHYWEKNQSIVTYFLLKMGVFPSESTWSTVNIEDRRRESFGKMSLYGGGLGFFIWSFCCWGGFWWVVCLFGVFWGKSNKRNYFVFWKCGLRRILMLVAFLLGNTDPETRLPCNLYDLSSWYLT